MVQHLRLRVNRILATIREATLVTSGPAGIQARLFPCEAEDLRLYMLVPGTSDQLLNLEHNSDVVVSTAGWQLFGSGRALTVEAAPPDITLLLSPAAAGCTLVEVAPRRLQLNRRHSWGYSETIDLE